jgi:hypothetical protein
MSQGRIDKTLDKTRRGLPPPTDDRPVIESGNGNRCSGAQPYDALERLVQKARAGGDVEA